MRKLSLQNAKSSWICTHIQVGSITGLPSSLTQLSTLQRLVPLTRSLSLLHSELNLLNFKGGEGHYPLAKHYF